MPSGWRAPGQQLAHNDDEGWGERWAWHVRPRRVFPPSAPRRLQHLEK